MGAFRYVLSIYTFDADTDVILCWLGKVNANTDVNLEHHNTARYPSIVFLMYLYDQKMQIVVTYIPVVRQLYYYCRAAFTSCHACGTVLQTLEGKGEQQDGGFSWIRRHVRGP